MANDQAGRPTDGDEDLPIPSEVLHFLRLSRTDLKALSERDRPLGTSEASFKYFVSSLADALVSSNVDACDIRLQGSSAGLYSGAHKSIPWTRLEIYNLFKSLQRRLPRDFEIDSVLTDLNTLWPDAASRPKRRLFDLLHRLKIDLQPSDIDVQISSDALYDAAMSRVLDLRIPMSEACVASDTYGFVEKHLVKAVAPALSWWADEQSAIHQRLVAVAVFPSNGPPRADDEGALSSHFRDTDWQIALSLVAQDA